MTKDIVERLNMVRSCMEDGVDDWPIASRIYEYKAAVDEIESLRQQLAERDAEAGTAWAQAHRLALELECLLMDTKDNAVVSKWWDSAFEAMEEYNKLKPGAAEDAEVWAKFTKAGI